jgi:uncharacterized RDD family membrane protein YckC
MAINKSVRRFLDGDSVRRQREIVSPEGVPLKMTIARIGDRLSAYFIDVIVLLGTTLIFYLLLIFLIRLGLVSNFVVFLMMTGVYIVNNAYFLHFELKWQGATPGKRIVGLRVVDRRGGPLTPASVIARNLLRNFEVAIPLHFVLWANGFDRGFAFVWLICFALLPFLNRNRMRAGDFIGGTVVISLPNLTLSDDLAEHQFQFVFTDKHLAIYGTFELQVLEELLRRTTALDADQLLHEVGDKIRKKIGWTTPVPPEQEVVFLTDFYTAERAYLERNQLLGKLKPDKHHTNETHLNKNTPVRV